MDRAAWDERYRRETLLWSAEPNRFLAEEATNLTPGRALDLACGEGRNAVWLAARGWSVTAVDFSEVALEKARGLAEDHGVEVDWVVADVTEYEPVLGSYDFIAVLYLHLPADDRRLVLERAAAALAPAGMLLVVGHDISNLSHGVGGPQDPDILFAPTDITSDLEGVRDLLIERAEVVTRPVAVNGDRRDARDALVRARRK